MTPTGGYMERCGDKTPPLKLHTMGIGLFVNCHAHSPRFSPLSVSFSLYSRDQDSTVVPLAVLGRRVSERLIDGDLGTRAFHVAATRSMGESLE